MAVLKKAFLLGLAAAFWGASNPLFAQDPMDVYLGDKSIRPSLMKESAGAIFGRAFGVQDEKLDIDYHVFEFKSHTRGNALVRSALVPGWGQAFNRQHTKGALVLSVFAAAAGGSIVRYRQSRDSHNEYLRLGVKDSSKYDDYEKQRNQSYVLGAVAAGFWIFSMFDAYRQAYSPLWSDNNAFQFAFAPDEGSSLRAAATWRRRF